MENYNQQFIYFEESQERLQQEEDAKAVLEQINKKNDVEIRNLKGEVQDMESSMQKVN